MKNKNVVIGIVIVVLVIIGAVWYMQSNKVGSLSVDENTAPTEQVSTSTDTTNTQNSGTTLSYTDAVKLYGDRRIQFDNACQTIPRGTITFKNGTKVMVDNRANVARTFVFGPQTFTVKAYGYTVITLQSATLPVTLGIDCGKSINVVNVLIQK